MKAVDYRTKEVVWLLEFEYCAKVYRYADRAVVMTDEAGNDFRYLSGLKEFNLKRTLLLGDTNRVKAEIDATFDWAGTFATSKIPLEGHTATVRRAYLDEPLERAEVMATGRITGVEYGAVEEPLTFSIEKADLSNRGIMPDSTEVIDDTTQPLPLAQDIGSYTLPGDRYGTSYNLIIGYPGNGEQVVPAPMVAYNWGSRTLSLVLVSTGHIDAEQVRARNMDMEFGAFATENLIKTYDRIGRPITVMDFTLDDSIIPTEDGTEFFVGFRKELGGGIKWNGEVLRKAADVIQWAIETYTDVKLDLGRWESYRDYLNTFNVDTFINEPVEPMEWIEEDILPMLPVRTVLGKNGLYLLPLRYTAKRHEVQWYLNADDHNIIRTTKIKEATEEVYNRLTVEYGPGKDPGLFTARLIITSQKEKEEFRFPTEQIADRRLVVNAACSVSQDRMGIKPKTIQLKSVWDRDTAIKVGEWMLARDALPKKIIRYEAGLEWAKVEIGDVVMVTDAEVSIYEQLALVDDLTLGSQTVELTLMLLDNLE